MFVSEPAPHHKSWRPSHQRHIKRIPKIQLCWNIWDLLKDLRHKQYVWSVPREVSRPLLKKRNSLTMFTTAIQKQLNCTRCWGGTGPDETPQAKWGQVQDQVSPRSQLRKKGGTGGVRGQQRFWYTCWAETGHQNKQREVDVSSQIVRKPTDRSRVGSNDKPN